MYRIGKEEIKELTRVIETQSLFKVNDGLQESMHVEQKLREILNIKYPIFMTSGYAALATALTALGIGPGDQVIVPAYTYIATAMAVVKAGAIPVIAEVDATLTLSPEDLERKITPYTKAVIPVHIQGFPCNMDAICEIAQKHNLLVIEDACQADGGSYKGKRLGCIGDAGAYSFNYFKIISSGEGGALLTNRRDVFETALIYQDSSAIAFFGNQMDGFKAEAFCGDEYRSNELCAALVNVQLSRLDGILADLRKNKAYMMEALKDNAEFIPSNDIEGDCGTTLAFRFEDEKKAEAFSQMIGGTLPINTGKHIYTHWTPILEKKGAFNPKLDPFKMEANKAIIPDYSVDSCPKTLEYLKNTVYHSINPDDTMAELDKKIAFIKNALLTIQ